MIDDRSEMSQQKALDPHFEYHSVVMVDHEQMCYDGFLSGKLKVENIPEDLRQKQPQYEEEKLARAIKSAVSWKRIVEEDNEKDEFGFLVSSKDPRRATFVAAAFLVRVRGMALRDALVAIFKVEKAAQLWDGMIAELVRYAKKRASGEEGPVLPGDFFVHVEGGPDNLKKVNETYLSQPWIRSKL